MAGPFDITAATNTVALDNKREGTATFTVKNTTRRRVRAVARLLTTPPDSPALNWMSIVPTEGSTAEPATTDVRDFPIDATQQYQVRVAAPPEAAPGSYAFKLVVADEINPDEQFTQSPDVTFTVVEPPKEEPRKFPVWIIPVILVVIAIVAVIIFLVVKGQQDAEAAAAATATAVEDARMTADAGATATIEAQAGATATAEANLTATAAANQTATASAATATRQALGLYIGSWVPVGSAPPSGVQNFTITEGNNGLLNFNYSSRCPPTGNLCTSVPLNYGVSNIPYDPQRLLISIESTAIQIEPTNNNRMFVTMFVAGETLTGVYQRGRISRPFDDFEIVVTLSANVIENAIEINPNFRFVMTPFFNP